MKLSELALSSQAIQPTQERRIFPLSRGSQLYLTKEEKGITIHTLRPARRIVDAMRNIRNRQRSLEPQQGEIEPQQSIIVEYNGNLSDKMDWQLEQLTHFAKIADLRTTVTIRRSSNQARSEVTAVGDILALRRIGNPFELFTIRQSKEEILHTEVNFVTGQATIEIEDQLLTRKNLEKNNGRLHEELFVKEVNRLVRKGLTDILVKEKLYQAKVATLMDAYFTPPILSYLVACGLAAKGVESAVVATLIYGFTNNYLDVVKQAAEALIEVGLAPGILYASGLYLNRVQKPHDLQHTSTRYLKKMSDLVPVKHIAHAMVGEHDLATKDHKLVTYIP